MEQLFNLQFFISNKTYLHTFFYLSDRILYKWSVNHTGFFLFSPFFFFLIKQTVYQRRENLTACLRWNSSLCLSYLEACLREMMDFGTLSCLLSFSGIFLFKVSLSYKRPVFSGSGCRSFIFCKKGNGFILETSR